MGKLHKLTGSKQVCLMVACLAVLIGASSFPSAHAQDIPLLAQQGLNLSQTHCGRCHIVAKDRFAGIASTPSFKIMIQALDDWEDRFDTFMARNPHPAHMRLEGADERPEDLPSTIKEVILTLDEIEAILVYVDYMAEELGRTNP